MTEASWHQDRSKIDVYLEKRCFEKALFFLRKSHTFEGSGGQSWYENSIKNRSENALNIGRSIGISLWWSLMDDGKHAFGMIEVA